MIYLDNAATTYPKPDVVYDTVDRYNRTKAVNPGRGAYAAAREATDMVRNVKKKLISLIDARGQAEVVLTPSVTIALNQILLGFPWEAGMTAYITPYEHNAVIRPLALLEKRRQIRIRTLPLNETGAIDLPKMEEMFRSEPPALVCVTAVSNVTGYVLPAAEIFRIARLFGAFTVLDAAQALGLVKMRFAALGADVVTFAGHKTLYATFGIAGFYIRNGADLNEVLTGGNGIKSEDPFMPRYMPEKMETGSMNSPAIAGLEAALGWLTTVDPWRVEAELTEYLLARLPEVKGIRIYKAPEGAPQAGVVSFNIEGFRANEVAAILDKTADIAVRAGHHCAGLIHPYLDDHVYDGTVRVSVGVFNTKEDIDRLIDALHTIDPEVLKSIDKQILRGNC
ncbi:MAG: aminotransferase class V-fold PLP-dependent enzyme [Eubacterium sp.]|nr:aminotransferase class V-fold PLP-dependent enzyme [Eubacterium sp.]